MSEASGGIPGAGDRARQVALDLERVNRDFNWHPASRPSVADNHDAWREDFRSLAQKLVTSFKPSRERSLALTHLEEVMFWVNAAIARDQVGFGEE